MSDVLAIIMAGGKGERLAPLTNDRSKPSVPFGGIYRLVDITLSNCINSGIYKMMVLPQYKSQSLVDHLEAGWNIFSFDLGHYLRIVSPQMRRGEKGTRHADTVRRKPTHRARSLGAPSLILTATTSTIWSIAVSGAITRPRGPTDFSVIEWTGPACAFGVVEETDFKIKAFPEKPK